MDTPDIFPDRLISDRLLIRPAAPGDGEAFYAALIESQAELSPWLAWTFPPPSVAFCEMECRKAHGCYLLGEDLMVFLFERGSGRLVGGGGLHKADWKLRKFEVGYWCRTGHGGQGLITEAVQTLADHAMTVLRANRLELSVDDNNRKSWQLAERAGFSLEGLHRNAGFTPQGRLRHLRIYAKIPA
ncbi:GNAT family N-acetyltransferase [Ideonella sp. 4Y16]|uniref:GNAT family N-acetyltransferase n=1 Tax=Ideonella alba TaxID=2824118 RepID=UPI001B38E635|nr:GNAT family protein [Ideonella alba]MBQ0943580.1 GNAT family N-acetyltransferase [Ideonella alba]